RKRGPRAAHDEQRKLSKPEANSAVPRSPHLIHPYPDVTVDPSVAPANSGPVFLSGKSVQLGAGIAVTFCLNNTLRHSRPIREVADDWISPAFPAPASTPVAAIIGLAEERFGLRKSPTAPMP